MWLKPKPSRHLGDVDLDVLGRLITDSVKRAKQRGLA
jgi:hypothetical protein